MVLWQDYYGSWGDNELVFVPLYFKQHYNMNTSTWQVQWHRVGNSKLLPWTQCYNRKFPWRILIMIISSQYLIKNWDKRISTACHNLLVDLTIIERQNRPGKFLSLACFFKKKSHSLTTSYHIYTCLILRSFLFTANLHFHHCVPIHTLIPYTIHYLAFFTIILLQRIALNQIQLGPPWRFQFNYPKYI